MIFLSQVHGTYSFSYSRGHGVCDYPLSSLHQCQDRYTQTAIIIINFIIIIIIMIIVIATIIIMIIIMIRSRLVFNYQACVDIKGSQSQREEAQVSSS